MLMQWPRFFEIEDQPWFPQVLRDQITDALQFLILEMKAYDPILPELNWVIQKSGRKNIVDLCSGATGPWDYLVVELLKQGEVLERITLTDLFPNENALKRMAEKNPIFKYNPIPADVLDIDRDLDGIRTLFSSFHHFNRAQAVSILQDAVDKQMPICVFEFTGRRAANFILTPFVMFGVFAKLLFKKRLTFSRLLFSYLIPIVPLALLWDSTVSHLRTYSPAELNDLLSRVNHAESFEWEIGETTSPKTVLSNTYLIGYPKENRVEQKADPSVV
jgi:hypothetical protein